MARVDGLTDEQVQDLLERGYTPRTGFGGTSWDPPNQTSSRITEIIGAVGAVLLLVIALGFLGYWLVR